MTAKPDERWTQRPPACCVVLADDAAVGDAQLTDHLRLVAAKWWLPDESAFIDMTCEGLAQDDLPRRVRFDDGV